LAYHIVIFFQLTLNSLYRIVSYRIITGWTTWSPE